MARSLRTIARSYVIRLLEDYPNYDKHVKQREFELAHPLGKIDDNIGGGKAQNKYSNPVDQYLITCEEDKRLTDLSQIHATLTTCLTESSMEVQTICKELYFKKRPYKKYYTVQDLCIAGVLHMGKTTAYDMLNEFLDKCARELGLMTYV